VSGPEIIKRQEMEYEKAIQRQRTARIQRDLANPPPQQQRRRRASSRSNPASNATHHQRQQEYEDQRDQPLHQREANIAANRTKMMATPHTTNTTIPSGHPFQFQFIRFIGWGVDQAENGGWGWRALMVVMMLAPIPFQHPTLAGMVKPQHQPIPPLFSVI